MVHRSSFSARVMPLRGVHHADILETMSDGFIAVDREWRITWLNAAAERDNEIRRADVLGKIHWDVFPSVLGTDFERHLRRAMTERVPLRMESFFESRGRWYMMAIHPISDGGLVLYGRDISERVQADESRRRLERERDELLTRLQLQFERMPIACVVTDPRLRVLGWNPAAETIFGYRRDEAIGKDASLLLVRPGMRPYTRQVARRLAAGDMSVHAVHENVTKDGRTIVCEWRNTPLRDSTGTVIAFMAMAQDITDCRRAEQALRESEERYRSLVSQVKDLAIFSTDEHGIVMTWNEGCEQVLGYSEAEFIGLDSAELFTTDDRAAGVPEADRRQATETRSAPIDRWMNAKGTRRFFATGATTGLRAASGRLTGFSIVIRDLTPMRLRQDHLAEQGESLERLVTERTDQLEKATARLRISHRMAALGTLSAGLGHDMGNLLLPLDVRLRILLEADLPTELREHVLGIQTSARYLQQLSSGLRLLAVDPSLRRAKGETELSTWWNDVGMVLKNVLPRTVRFEHRMPSFECPVAIGRSALTQAVFNLVQNAADALQDRDTGRVAVNAEGEWHGSWVIIRVSDDGVGMTEEVVRRCTEPYFSTKTRAVSTGLGLAFVQGLVTEAGGHLEIDSQVGFGTTISLVLPRAVPEEAQVDDRAPRAALVELHDRRLESFIKGELRALGFKIRRVAAADEKTLIVVDSDSLDCIPVGLGAPKARVIVLGDASGRGPGMNATGTVVLAEDPDAISRVLRAAAGATGAAGAT